MLTSVKPAPLDDTRDEEHDLASACRAAALEFLNESRRWSKAELSTWLSDSYGALIQADGETVWPLALLDDIDARLIDRIMSNARTEITRALARMAENGSATFVLNALIEGFVVQLEDSAKPSWAPSPTAGRLVDRVFSLLAVDYLTRSGDYEESLVVCGRCGVVSFAGKQTTCNACAGGRRTIPYPPMTG